jgi:hypothetical protein
MLNASNTKPRYTRKIAGGLSLIPMINPMDRNTIPPTAAGRVCGRENWCFKYSNILFTTAPNGLHIYQVGIRIPTW